MSFKDTQSYKELQADWRWIHSMAPEAAAAADLWVKDHPEEWKELEHMLLLQRGQLPQACCTGHSGRCRYQTAHLLQSGSVPAGGSAQCDLRWYALV